MALLHTGSTLSPTKPEVVTAWLGTQSWCPADPTDLEMIGGYRFDDPAGEVGIESLLVRLVDGSVMQVPLTYRDAPLAGADDFLVCTMTHTALGDRWVYAGGGDPVLVTAFVTAILTGADQAALQAEVDGRLVTRDPVVTARGSGDPATVVGPVEWIGAEVGRPETVVHTSAGDLFLPHLPAPAADDAHAVLRGLFPGAGRAVELARLG